MTQISIPHTQGSENPEDVNASLKKAEGANVIADGQKVELTPPSETPSAHERPENVPEKFWNAETGEVNTEALLKSYAHLESSKGKQNEQSNEEANTAGETNNDDTAVKENEAEQSTAPFSMDSLQEEYVANGELSADTYSNLEKFGFDRETVDSFIAGREAIAKKNLQEAAELVGGEEVYSEMIQWAKDLPADEIEKFNAQINDPNFRDIAIQALHQKFVKANPVSLEGNSSVVSTAGFASKDEWMSAMKDSRYHTDAAYRASVEAKLKASPHLYLR